MTMQEAYENGKIVVWLKGEKLTGGYALIRTGDGEGSRWLLIKADDPEADARRKPLKTEPESVASGQTIDDLKDRDK